MERRNFLAGAAALAAIGTGTTTGSGAAAQDGWRQLSLAEVQQKVLGRVITARGGELFFAADHHLSRPGTARYARGRFAHQVIADGRIVGRETTYTFFEKGGKHRYLDSAQGKYVPAKLTSRSAIKQFPRAGRLSAAEVQALFGLVLEGKDVRVRLRADGIYEFRALGGGPVQRKRFTLLSDGEIAAEDTNIILFRKNKKLRAYMMRTGREEPLIILNNPVL